MYKLTSQAVHLWEHSIQIHWHPGQILLTRLHGASTFLEYIPHLHRFLPDPILFLKTEVSIVKLLYLKIYKLTRFQTISVKISVNIQVYKDFENGYKKNIRLLTLQVLTMELSALTKLYLCSMHNEHRQLVSSNKVFTQIASKFYQGFQSMRGKMISYHLVIQKNIYMPLND